MQVSLSRMHFPVTSLGPGRRVGVWVQGCSIQCPGCISMDTWAAGKGRVDLSQMFALLADWLPQADGITISGGEPFDQAAQLTEILVFARRFSHINTFVYSGYELEKIEEHLQAMKGLIDLLMSDPFDHSYAQSLALRGSDNQRLNALTEEGAKLLSDSDTFSVGRRQLDFSFDGETAWMAGVPKRHDISHAVDMIKQDNVDSRSSEGKSSRLKVL